MKISPSLRTLSLTLIALVSLTIAGNARAQVTSVDPYYVALSAPSVKLWSGPDAAWYAIAVLDQGAVLMVDGESDGWLRVAYPKGTPALVRAEEVELINNGGAVRLTRPSSLRAYDMNNPTYIGCYKGVFFNKIPAGTELKVISELRGPTDQLDGYFVEAPDSARGFIIETRARDATQAEIEAYRLARATPTTPANNDNTAEPNTTNEPTTTIVQDDTNAGDDVATDDDGDASTDPPTIATPLREPDEPRAPENTADLDAFDKAYADFERLDEAYTNVMAQPVLEAELDELIDEYKTLVSGLDAEDATYGAIIDHAKRRIMALELQQRVRAARRQLSQLRDQADAERETTRTLTQSTRNSTTEYAFVGRLLPSAVYTGDRLPELYRLVSVSGVTGRTLGYIIPDPSLKLESKVGSVVGVVGQRATADSRVGVIDVQSIEPLSPGE